MKKFIALLLLAVLMLNLFGQMALRQYLAYKTERFYNEQISKGLYNIHDLAEIEIPVNLPGIHDWARFENITGQIMFGSASYNYVKMRLTRTAIHLMCIPHYDTTRPVDNNVLNAKGVKDIPVPQKDHVPNGKTIMLDNLNFAFNQYEFYCPIKSIQTNIIQAAQSLVYQQQSVPEQPPKVSC
ncbi:MAG TPA: hypothetical protein VIM77_14780 [Mucilaginibacter sp.]